MKNRFNRFHFITMTAALLGPAALAAPVYSTLGSNNSFDTNDFITIGGTEPAGAYSDAFISPETTTAGSISVAVGEPIISPAASITVAIRSNTPTGPGGIIGLFSDPILPNGPNLLNFSSLTGVQLQAGTEYWLSVGSGGLAGNLFIYLNNQGIDSDTASRKGGRAWTLDGSAADFAFALHEVPEPGSPALGAMILVTACLWRRRTKNRRACARQ